MLSFFLTAMKFEKKQKLNFLKSPLFKVCSVWFFEFKSEVKNTCISYQCATDCISYLTLTVNIYKFQFSHNKSILLLSAIDMFWCFFWIIVLLVSTETANGTLSGLRQKRCWSSGNGESARWFNHGEQISRGPLLFLFLGWFRRNSDRIKS